MFIDTHCHLSKEDYDDIDLVLKENRDAGISKIVVSGCEISNIDEVLDFANRYEDVYITLGYHPSEVDSVTDSLLDDLKENLKIQKLWELGKLDLIIIMEKKENKNRLNYLKSS